MPITFTKDDLKNLSPSHDTFVGLDSDGCVFDTMELKQKQCFHPSIIAHWHLEPVEKPLRECAEFVNLYSRSRGSNRFPALLATFDLLREHPEIKGSDVVIPTLSSLRDWVDSGDTLGNPRLEELVAETSDPVLADVLEWSLSVNRDVESKVRNIPPFPHVRDVLRKMQEHSDTIVVSQTPEEALIREWRDNDLTQFVRVIAGQELGTKQEHIEMAAGGKYEPGKLVMIGDALGDYRAAHANNALFFPINPGKEELSWKRLADESYNRFLEGTYHGSYQKKLIEEFLALLPEHPPWLA